MKRIAISTILLMSISFTACDNTTAEQEKASTAETSKTNNMKNLISIAEIPVSDFARATKFYAAVLNVSIEEMSMDGNQMGILPADEGAVNVVLIKGDDYNPTSNGALLYLNAGDDLQPTLTKTEQNGGQVIVPKTEISPEMGFFALFVDTEGNKLGLHSTN